MNNNIKAQVQYKPKISVILPTYNEKENINELIAELRLYLSTCAGDDFEIIVVDDDSPDLTWGVVKNFYVNELRVRIIRRINERSLASAIWRGIQESSGAIVCWMDCDFSMPPYKLVELIKNIYDGYDVVVGSRFVKGGKDLHSSAGFWLATILSRTINSFISFMLDSSIKDYTSGFVAVKRNVFDGIKIKGDYGEYFIEFIYDSKNSGYKIIEIPYYCLPRRAGSSKTGSNLIDYIKKGRKYILLTLRLKWKSVMSNKYLKIFLRELSVIKRMLRRRYYMYFRPEYVRQQLERRRGACGQHGCCDLSVLQRIYNLSYRKCLSRYGHSRCEHWKNLPQECKIYPLDEKDKIPETKNYCNFYWEE